MWNLLENFASSIVLNEKTATTKLTFSEFLKEWKIRLEPPRMKKLEMLGSVENAMPIMFPSLPTKDEFTDVTFVVDGMAGIQARSEWVDTDAFGRPVQGGAGGQKRIVRKVIKRVKKKKADGTPAGDDESGEEEEVEEEVDADDDLPSVSPFGDKKRGLAARTFDDDDESEALAKNSDISHLLNYAQGLSSVAVRRRLRRRPAWVVARRRRRRRLAWVARRRLRCPAWVARRRRLAWACRRSRS